jgi:SPP1 family predicted phage head-tail adaptor
MRAGKLDRKVQLLTPAEWTDSRFGGKEAAWDRTAQFYAEFRDLSGREALLAQQMSLNVSSSFTFRYRTDVKAKCRMEMEGRLFEVVSILEDRRAGEMSAMVVEVSVG